MKIVAFVGSARKKHTYNSTEKFLQYLESYGDIEYEIVPLNEYELKMCRGCKLCMDKGEELCPLRDDRDVLIEKMKEADGVIMASPNYSFQVSGLMKVFLDHLGFAFHRPMFFGKTYTSIVAQGVYGGKDIVKYLNFVGRGLGFNLVKGVLIKTLEPMTEKANARIEATIKKGSKKFYDRLLKQKYPTPSVFSLMIYRMSRTSMNRMLDENYRDYNYFTEQGWFENDYYYPVKLNPIKKVLGKVFDFSAKKMSA